MRKGCLWFTVSFLFFLATADAQVPKLLHYQGHLVDGQGIPLEGGHELTFRLYEFEVGGSVLWSQTFTSAQVQMAQGNFAVLLDVSTADPAMVKFDKRYWLSIEVDGDGEMSPRQSIASSAYALNSDTVDTFHASATATANTLLPLDANAKFPQSVLDIQEGPDGNFDADTVDTFHASEAAAANTLLPLNANSRFPQEVMPIDLDADTVDKKDSTFLLDLTKHTGVLPSSQVQYEGLNADKVDGYHAGHNSDQIPISDGTVNTNLNADLLDGKHLSDFIPAVTQTNITGLIARLGQPDPGYAETARLRIDVSAGKTLLVLGGAQITNGSQKLTVNLTGAGNQVSGFVGALETQPVTLSMIVTGFSGSTEFYFTISAPGDTGASLTNGSIIILEF